MRLVPKRLGDILIEAKLLTPAQLESALEVKKASGSRLGEVLVGLGIVADVDIAQALAKQLSVPYVSSEEVAVDPEVAKIISEQSARRYWAVPVAKEGNVITVAMSDPLNVFALDDISLLTGSEVRPVVTTDRGIEKAIQVGYQQDLIPPRDAGAPSPTPTDELETFRLREMVEEAPIVRLVNQVIDRAMDERASDIHIEPLDESVRVRYRIDGMLREVMTVPKANHAATVSRIKIMAMLDISERRVPQDGRIRVKDQGRDADLRVSTLPTIHGEKVVIRILDKSKTVNSLDEIGFLPDTLEKFRPMIKRPHGMVLITGPTGSGKTTTLTAILRELNSESHNIITVEDPVEYEVPGVNQVNVNERAGLTFASGLRSILRQDPNIIMVGEVRDAETADIAIRSALTGHLVLSTLHTNDASGTITRLIDMGVEPFLLSSSIIGVVAQRLARLLCPRCKEPYELPADDPHRGLAKFPEGPVKLYRAKGCPECGKSGYRGRAAIFELMPVTAAVRELITKRAPAAALYEQAVREGMRPLLQDGVEKALKGLTSVEEVFRVAYTEDK
ncbi:MAG TPA: ATPase, T2SS/T4P/T4SS family [Bacillota bacterium]|jgi:type IV pilus assembly protein PilB